MSSCNMCSTNITKAKFPGINCAGPCNKLFHIRCAQISDDLMLRIKDRSASWLCLKCRDTSNQSIIEGEDDVSDAQIVLPSLSDIMFQLKCMDRKLSALEALKAMVTSLVSENKELKTRIDKLESQLLNNTTKLHLLEAENDKPNQQQNASSITITGLPINHGDIRGVIINTIKKLGVEINTDDIVSIQGKQKSNTDLEPGSNNNRSKPVLKSLFIVKLKNVELKNNILAQTKKHKTLSCKDLDVSLPVNHPMQRIFVMHYLTSFQSKLYHEAKNIKLKYNYKFLWCKNGQIYLRNSEGSNAHRIQSFCDIFRVASSHHPIENAD